MDEKTQDEQVDATAEPGAGPATAEEQADAVAAQPAAGDAAAEDAVAESEPRGQIAADLAEANAPVDAVAADALADAPSSEPGEALAAEADEQPPMEEPEEAAVEMGDEASAAPAVGMPTAELRAIVEALVFASPEPITPKMLYKILSGETKEDVSAAINDLRADYLSRPGLQWVEVAGGYQITTRPELHEWVRRLFHERTTQKLSVQALETLAVIAYRQPVTALEITEIRGVNTSGVLTTLLERHLVKIVGRKNVVGRPFMYATTKEFLIRFGLKDLADLPKVEDMAEALGFEPPAGLVEQATREDMLPLDEETGGEDKTPIEDAPA